MNRPAAVEITYECMRFLITHNPTNSTLNKFTEVRVCVLILFQVYVCKAQGSNLCSFDSALKELKKFEVNTLVRVCEATYDKAPVEREGIQVLVCTIGQVSYYKPLAHSNYS